MQKLKATDETIQRARERFNRTRQERGFQCKLKIDFDELYELFGNDCNTFSGIAQKFGCTRENIRQLYRKYFAHLFRDKTGRKRRRTATLKRSRMQSKDFSKAPEILKDLAETALAKGLNVERIKRQSSYGRFSTTDLLINGKRCNIHSLSRARKGSPGAKQSYSCFSPSYGKLKEVDFVIVVQKVFPYPQRVFILPKALLEKFMDKPRKYIYVPLQKLPIYYNIRPNIDFWDYLGAWHLLKNF